MTAQIYQGELRPLFIPKEKVLNFKLWRHKWIKPLTGRIIPHPVVVIDTPFARTTNYSSALVEEVEVTESAPERESDRGFNSRPQMTTMLSSTMKDLHKNCGKIESR